LAHKPRGKVLCTGEFDARTIEQEKPFLLLFIVDLEEKNGSLEVRRKTLARLVLFLQVPFSR